MHDWVFQGTTNETLRTDYQGEVDWHFVQSYDNYSCSHCSASYSSASGSAGWVESYKL
jgi:hypothetical protein